MMFFLSLMFAFPLHVYGENHSASKGEYVLIVSTYISSAPWSNELIESVQKIVLRHDKISIFIEHLNMLLVEDAAQFDKIKQTLFSKYAACPPKAVVMLGNPMLLLRDDIKEQWGDVPMIVCAEMDFIAPDSNYILSKPVIEEQRIPLSNLMDKYNMTVLQTRMFPQENIELLERMVPDLKKVILIGDGRYFNQQLDYDMRRLITAQYPNLEYDFLSATELSLDDLVERLNEVEASQTGVLFSSWSSKSNVIGNTVLDANSFRIIGNISLPIFALKYAVMPNSGLIGGYIFDRDKFFSKLQHVIDIAITYIQTGQDDFAEVRNIPCYIPEEAVPTFDYPSLLMKGFSVSSFPSNSVFLNRPVNFFERNKYVLIWGILLLAALLVYIYVHQRNRIVSLRELDEVRRRQLETDRELISLFENMPVFYMKAKFMRDDAGSPDDIAICRMNGRFINHFVGATYENNQRGSELLGDDFKLFLPYLKLVDEERKPITFTQYISKSDIYIYAVMTPATQEEHVDIYCVDATDLYYTQRKLDETNRKLGLVLDVANIVPWHWDLRKQTILCEMNRPDKEADGIPVMAERRMEVPETMYFSKIHKEDRERVHQAWRELIEGRTSKIYEEYRIINRTAFGFRLDWVEVRAAVESRDEKGLPLSLIGSSHVITDRKRMESELITTKEKAEESNRLKSAFLANMSHEIRTPLNAIVGFSGLLNSTEEEEEREEYVRIIENNNTLLLQLIGDILDLSKIEAGTFEFVEAPVDVNTLMEDVIRVQQMRADAKNIKIEFRDHLPECCILTDRNRLSQILTNFLTNAIKFTENGSITVGYTSQKDMLRFYVTDTGCGIQREKQADIFERFVKLNNFAQGTGLGLSICKTIVNKMGGEIGVDSEPGKGSTFWFVIPDRKAVIPEKPVVEHELQAVSKSDITVLVAEDNDSNFKFFESILRKDYRLLHAWNGAEAVEMFKMHRPHIVLMDINMPVMDGYEATSEIRKISADVPILAVTAYAYASDEQRILNYGFDDYASKPVNPNLLRSKILDLLATRLVML
jgi:signal transduction histidine kinase/CheY-like chemotaxis protein